MAAALLTKETVTLSNVPKVRDTHLMAEILGGLGGSTEGDGVVSLNMAGAQASDVPADLGRRMRATILLLGARLGRFGRARLPRPGGDDIGARRAGQHPAGVGQLGGRVTEPGAGVSAEAGTYAIGVAATGGEVRLECSRPEDLNMVLLKLEQAGAHVESGNGWFRVGRQVKTRLRPNDMSTWTFPGFPTDLQAQYMALMTQASGQPAISDHVLRNRSQHVAQLAKMVACITVEEPPHP